MGLFDTNLVTNKMTSQVITSDEYFDMNERSLVSERLKSDGPGITFSGFMDLINKIIKATNEEREDPITFIPYRTYSKTQDIETPIITYRTFHRAPVLEKSPRYRETVNDSENNSKAIVIKGQLFTYTAEFTVYHDTYANADNTMLEFEDILTSYKGFFQQQGVSNIKFKEQLPDDSIDERENIFTKVFHYDITIEKITLVSESKIKTITSKIQNE